MGSEPDRIPDGDWPMSFEAVRLHQHLRFRALPAVEKIRAMEDMAELCAAIRKPGSTDDPSSSGSSTHD